MLEPRRSPAGFTPMKVAVYTDYVYREVDGVVHAERAFALFLAALVPYFDRRGVDRAPRPGRRCTLRPRARSRAPCAPLLRSLASPVAPLIALLQIAQGPVAGARRRRRGVGDGSLSACDRARADRQRAAPPGGPRGAPGLAAVRAGAAPGQPLDAYGGRSARGRMAAAGAPARGGGGRARAQRQLRACAGGPRSDGLAGPGRVDRRDRRPSATTTACSPRSAWAVSRRRRIRC